MFCPQTFDEAAEKDDHILQHFAQETCRDCDQNLIRIGVNLYVLHNSLTCIKSKQQIEKKETDNLPSLDVSTLNSIVVKEENIYDVQTESNEQEYIHMYSETNPFKSEQIDEPETQPLCIPQVLHISNDINFNAKQPTQINDQSSRLECNVCGKYFMRNFDLRRHKAKIHNESGYRCALCNAVFMSKIGVEKHQLKCIKNEKNQGNIIEFECDYCNIKCKKKFNLVMHMQSKHNPDAKTFKCKYCKKVIWKTSEIQRHRCVESASKVSHTNPGLTDPFESLNDLYQSSVPEMKTEPSVNSIAHSTGIDMRPTLINQLNPTGSQTIIFPETSIQSNDQLVRPECTICKKDFYSKFDLQRHNITHHNGSGYRCNSCNAILVTKIGWEKHQSKCNTIFKKKVSTYVGEIGIPTVQGPDGRIECELCGKSLANLKSLRKHMAFIHVASKYQCNFCKSMFLTRRGLVKHDQAKCHLHKYECKFCKASFYRNSNLKLHILYRHSPNVKRFRCKPCRKEFFDESKFKTHQCKSIIKGERFKCGVCGEIAENRVAIREHKIRAHSAPDSLFCNKCTRYYPDAVSLANHENNCTLLIPKQNSGKFWQCFMCAKTFRKKWDLNNHTHRVHLPGYKKFKCEHCECQFMVSSELKSHVDRVHLNLRPFICSTCGLTFKLKLHLTYHEYIHTGEKPFKCTEEGCDKYFRTIPCRDRHSITHKGIKRFHCSIDGCDKRFAASTPFRDHRLKKHGVLPNKCFRTMF